jgi:tRNA(fMet)-specific endonuclease VapC
VTPPAYLLDTCICVRMLRDQQCRVALRVRREAQGRVAIPAIAWAELAKGGSLAPLGGLPLWPFDAAAADAFPRAAKARGKYDRLIAAQALSIGATLVTANTRDFRDVPGLRIEDWTI